MTRIEIAEAVGAVFGPNGATRGEIVDAATSTGTRTEVAQVLSALPERRYARLNQLWEELTDLPVGV